MAGRIELGHRRQHRLHRHQLVDLDRELGLPALAQPAHAPLHSLGRVEYRTPLLEQQAAGVGERGLAWRISYPGLVPHGGFFDAPDGLVVVYAHGPSSFVMRYEDASVDGAATLNGNPWIDFDGARPVLLTTPRPQAGARAAGR
jgi:hypothetical protein